VHHSFGDFAKAREDCLDGQPRGDLAPSVASHAVGEGEEPALRLDLLARHWEHMANAIFVLVPAASGVAEFGKFEIKHFMSSGVKRFVYAGTLRLP
jgi:hypothetical protein